MSKLCHSLLHKSERFFVKISWAPLRNNLRTLHFLKVRRHKPKVYKCLNFQKTLSDYKMEGL